MSTSILDAQDLIMGFPEEETDAQITLEAKFDALLNADNLNSWMKYLTAQPHHVGSPYDKKVVDFVAAKFKEWGYQVRIEKFDVLFPTPKLRLVEMLAPTTYKASLIEPPVKGDPYSDQTKEALPGYNAFSVDGDVTADLVFVNYGIPEDYVELERRGISVEGKIVIAKYAGSWRGIKPKLAAEKGAIGCLIYSDPEDDGYYRGDVYPKGPFKNEYGIQRGSVMDMPMAPGDPLTPGYGATDDAVRIDIKEANTLTKIPVLPISYHDALPLLTALEGPVVPNSWKGALPITYHIGPGPAKVHLKLEFNWELKPAYDVIATMKGSTLPDEWVIRGNHHDAWVHGANDPISGLVALMEEARVVGDLVKQGHQPKRTMMYCAWGAEEQGLLGSTEWVETHAKELKEKVVAYINTDGTGAGFLNAGGSHTLEMFFDEISKSVMDPVMNVSVFERRNALEKVKNNTSWAHYKLGALGSGSDYSPFFQHLGIASFNMGFGGESSGGEYHTMYDSYQHYKRFKDPNFQYGVTLAKVAGRTSLRLANAHILPFEFTHFTSVVKKYANEVINLAGSLREDANRHNMLINNGTYALASNPKNNLKVPEKKASVPYFNFAPLDNALIILTAQSDNFTKTVNNRSLSYHSRRNLNTILRNMERALTREHGLPKRPWYKHHIYAPGFYTGYGVKTLPGVREAIEQSEFEQVQAQIDILASVINKFSTKIKEAISLFE
ncbi:MAG: transferrin receptor-like dimerization domain-containing protein [Flavobacteriaceae bacterium]|nr:transferrin receptor-like dimerization domain-containing protein [Flavobacteriaceae bacterium]MDG2350823.1 transferrin receptor-like dimerization domain-containing protein [Flavobacteriaceae bacterium]